MNSSFEKIIGSNIFKFVVGPHKKEYHIHGAAISTLSRPLDVLLNGQMREAEAKCIDWPDVDEKTFMRFAEWAYTKDYITEEPEIALDHSSVQVPASDHEAALTDNETPEKPLNTNCATSTFTFMPRKNTENCEDYTGVFLCHAQLYILGDKYDIPQLRQFTLYRLHATLKEFTLYPSRMSDIEILAKYIFDNTVPEDKIREMIILYYACIVEDVSKHDGLKRLIDEIPDFALGLISIMCERLE
ncbi:hypothetical protein VP1G_00960 [Cytospora mali]|uniref:BTB domain-containing protein n=1 Tax=Cytospora mali TaxID=578113 RepID=A0A194UPQ2_CYTMA|nr:hypothetical protein VP1G_00960 [Valsa mali var. pyri (nom. inval.)]